MKKLPKINFGAIKKHLPKSKRTKILLAATVAFVAIVAISGIAYLLIQPTAKEQDQKVTQKLVDVTNNEKATCQDILYEVGNASAEDVSAPEAKVTLLEKQMQCFEAESQFDKSIQSGEKLKQYYESSGDKTSAENVQLRIDSIKSVQDGNNEGS